MSTSKVTFLGRQFYQGGDMVVSNLTKSLARAKDVVEKIAPTGLLTPSQAAEYLAVAEV